MKKYSIGIRILWLVLLAFFSLQPIRAQHYHLKFDDIHYEVQPGSTPFLSFDANRTSGEVGFELVFPDGSKQKYLAVWWFRYDVSVINVKDGRVVDFACWYTIVSDSKGKSKSKKKYHPQIRIEPSSATPRYLRKVPKYRDNIAPWLTPRTQKSGVKLIKGHPRKKGDLSALHTISDDPPGVAYTYFNINIDSRFARDAIKPFAMQVTYVFRVKPGLFDFDGDRVMYFPLK
jgi:hypothetical protein